jgi:type III secretion system YscJ/HrcJ family lipoprotein
VAAAALLAAGCHTAVLHDRDEQDSNTAVAVLQDQGIMAAKAADNAENGTWKVTVPRRDATRALAVLQAYHMLESAAPAQDDGCGKKLFTSPLEERACVLKGLQRDIARTLKSVSGIVSARVLVALPEEELFDKPRGEVKASVTLEYLPDPSGRPPLREDEVRGIVANGVNDLKPESVQVVMKPILLVRLQRTYDFVAFGPIVVATPSVAAFKVLTGGVVAIVLALGASLYWSGRVISELRERLLDAQRPSQAIQKPPKPAA